MVQNKIPKAHKVVPSLSCKEKSYDFINDDNNNNNNNSNNDEEEEEEEEEDNKNNDNNIPTKSQPQGEH